MDIPVTKQFLTNPLSRDGMPRVQLGLVLYV